MSENGSSIAVISRQAGAILQLLLEDFEVIPKTLLEEPAKVAFGATLAPWPNRLEDGKYDHEGKHYEFFDIDAMGNKNHGLLRNQLLDVKSHTEHELVLSHRFGKDAGYPFEVDLEIHYVLEEAALVVSAIAKNLGGTAPFGIGFHPYFLAGHNFTVNADFNQKILTNDRMLPIATQPIAGLHFDHTVEEMKTLDGCFSGASEVTLTRDDGSFVVRALENFPYFMLYRPQQPFFAAGEALAIEPMSVKANAFKDPAADIKLLSGETKTYRFEIRKK